MYLSSSFSYGLIFTDIQIRGNAYLNVFPSMFLKIMLILIRNTLVFVDSDFNVMKL